MDHLEEHRILNPIQHGFRQKRSCESQLITAINDFSNCLNDKGQIDSILLDFSKAFDKVDHKGLLLKLKKYGISGQLLKWTESFLLNRTQTVIVDGTESGELHVKSGVPQGTVLGPLLFLIYINDIDEDLTPGTKLRLFADDSFLYRKITTKNDSIILQRDLNALQRWEKKWKMEFHPDKCQVLTITNKTSPIKSDYFIHDKLLKETNHARYLGVTIDSKLNWIEQNSSLCKKANSILGFLKRNTSKCPSYIKEKCYKTMVQPILDYGCTVWDPHHKNQIENIRKVEKNAARYVTNDYSYVKGKTDTHMKQLRWKPHQEARAKKKVTTMYKGVNGLLELSIDQFQLKSNAVRTRQSGEQVYNVPRSNIDSHMYSFFPSTFRLWNNLPTCIKLSNNVESFKNALQYITLTKAP